MMALQAVRLYEITKESIDRKEEDRRLSPTTVHTTHLESRR